jgi:glycosyltransferase involved in cell wall biosynthesis
MTASPMTASAVRVAVLWDSLSGYIHASLRALATEGAEVLVLRRGTQADAPFDDAAVTAGLRVETWADQPDVDHVSRALDAFDPHAVLVCGWHIGAYRRAARRLRGHSLRIVTMPNQWWGTAKQRGGVLASRWVVRPAYDAAFVCDERAAVFAQRLGFGADRLLWGMNTADVPRFAAVAEARGDAAPPERFAFVGRLVPDKAVDVLATAYARYRAAVDDPWPLVVAGTGPQRELLAAVPGVELAGFVQPDDLPDLLARSGCLVLPSRFEPWGVVVHEATAAGLPVVCTSVCGASTRLVLDGWNGVVVAPDDPGELARALVRIHRLGEEERRAMGRASQELAKQYSPTRWARTLLSRLDDLRATAGLGPLREPDVASTHPVQLAEQVVGAGRDEGG